MAGKFACKFGDFIITILVNFSTAVEADAAHHFLA